MLIALIHAIDQYKRYDLNENVKSNSKLLYIMINFYSDTRLDLAFRKMKS